MDKITMSLGEEEGCIYSGTMSRDQRKGPGVAEYDSGVRFEGEFKNNLPEGFGEFVVPDAGRWKGVLHQGVPDGLATFTLHDGTSFHANVRNGKVEGTARIVFGDGRTVELQYFPDRPPAMRFVTSQGNQYEGHRVMKPSLEELKHTLGIHRETERPRSSTFGVTDLSSSSSDLVMSKHWDYMAIHSLKTKNGDVYCGGFKEGKRHNQGEMKYANGRTYVGSFKNGRKHGRGTYIMTDGSKYEGFFKQGKRHGQGKYSSSDGTKYDGEFYQSKKHGYGIYTYSDGSVYQGEFVNDMFHGKGRYTYADGEWCEGDFVNDALQGYAEYYFSNGDVYKGNYLNNLMHGEGTYTFKEDRSYMGQFIEGRFSGRGIYSYSNGSFYEGTFLDDQKNGPGLFTDATGQRFREIWKMGVRISRTPLTEGTANEEEERQSALHTPFSPTRSTSPTHSASSSPSASQGTDESWTVKSRPSSSTSGSLPALSSSPSNDTAMDEWNSALNGGSDGLVATLIARDTNVDGSNNGSPSQKKKGSGISASTGSSDQQVEPAKSQPSTKQKRGKRGKMLFIRHKTDTLSYSSARAAERGSSPQGTPVANSPTVSAREMLHSAGGGGSGIWVGQGSPLPASSSPPPSSSSSPSSATGTPSNST